MTETGEPWMYGILVTARPAIVAWVVVAWADVLVSTGYQATGGTSVPVAGSVQVVIAAVARLAGTTHILPDMRRRGATYSTV
jgi:hypothetical protein